MDSTITPYSSFSFEWTVKSTSYQFRYRRAFEVNEIDEIFCTIISAKGNHINMTELGGLLGFNLQDLAEIDIMNIFLKGLTEYSLITIDKETIQLTEFGKEALLNKLKYKYYYATTGLLENQTATGENYDFSFKKVFDLENDLSHDKRDEKTTIENAELRQKLQFQLFDNDIYKGEIIELIQGKAYINYKNISLQCTSSASGKSFSLSFHKSGINKPELEDIINLPENEEVKDRLLRKAMYHHILANKDSITSADIETYIDLWNWSELAENPKVDWGDTLIFDLFRENGNGGVWNIISLNTPIANIESVINEYTEYWNWTTLTARFNNDFIRERIESLNWDFEELSYKEVEFVTLLLSNSTLKDHNWDWDYLSGTLPDEFIESHIDVFPWDFYQITLKKKEVFKNTFIKYRDKLEILIPKNWNWKFISQEINLNFLYKNIAGLASKVDWQTVLDRFFNNEEVINNVLREESFKSLLKQHLPGNFVVAHQKYFWRLDLIDFFEEQSLIQWESKAYINGFDTNETLEWSRDVFQKYHDRIVTIKGFRNVSEHITDYGLIEEFPHFQWDWEGISTNTKLIGDTNFIENAFSGKLSCSNNLHWNEILLSSSFGLDFWNTHLSVFYNTAGPENHIQFWKELTQKESQEYIFANTHFPWDWHFVTKNSSPEIILASFETEDLFEKWDWEIATQKLDKETILDNLEDLTQFINWKFIINKVFSVERELSMENQLPRIAACLSFLETENRKQVWEVLTAIYSFDTLIDYVESTLQIEVFEWNWDFISNHKYFPTDFGTLNRYREKINWTIFSESIVVQQKFNPNNWEDGWFRNTNNYLRTFADFWDWKILSKNKNLNYDRRIINNYKSEKWDWEHLSEFGGFLKIRDSDDANYLVALINQFRLFLKFEFVSKRKDILIDSDLIRIYQDRRWNWEILSENQNATLSGELLLELRGKTWDWTALSKRDDIDISNEVLIELSHKKWDWTYISDNKNLQFDMEFIEITKSKPWNWKAISRQKSFLPTIEILTITHEFDLDWKYLSQHPSLAPTRELLAKFENKWNWNSITKNPTVSFDDVDLIERFADKWDWEFICQQGKLGLSKQILAQFKDYLKWDLISSNTNIDFTKEVIQQFKPYWNWTALKTNKRVEELLGNYIAGEISNSAILSFIDQIEEQWSPWKGYIYHFSHIENAVEIIKNRKIQSRNKAIIRGDAAGNVVHLRNDAHDYARFYFRPHTPTQFYNEFLGKNTTDGYESRQYGWVSWYEKARGLGFPKCPVPIFFRFSLKEVLFKNEEMCCISNGNMQTSSTRFGSIEAMINKFGFHDLYYTPLQYATKEDYNRFRKYAQQEFLVKDGLSFNDLKDVEIVCFSDTDRTLLINLLGQQHKEMFAKIIVNTRYYNNENPRIRIEEEDSELHISTDFNGNGYFVLDGSNDIKEIEIISGDVTKVSSDKIIFNSYVSVGKVKKNIRLNFIDESGRNWFVYAK